MKCCPLLLRFPILTFFGNSPSPRPLGYFATLLPMFPIPLFESVGKGKKGNRTRKHAYTRIKVLTPFGNSNRKQRWLS